MVPRSDVIELVCCVQDFLRSKELLDLAYAITVFFHSSVYHCNIFTVKYTASVVTESFFLIRKLKCYHLVHAYGVVPGPNHMLLVMELMSRGDLLNYMRSLKAEDNDIFTVLSLDVSFSVDSISSSVLSHNMLILLSFLYMFKY